MKVELEKTYPVPGAASAAWDCLQDIQGVAGCMPGAKITERVDDRHYKGTVTVRVGPATMTFKGDLEVQELDAARHVLHLVGKGSDTTGSSGASMDLVARIEPGAADGASNLVGRSEVTINGKAAAFAGRMMGTVADQILKQFAANFAAQVQARASTPAATSGATSVPSVAPSSPANATSTPSSAIPTSGNVTLAPDSATPAGGDSTSAPNSELNAIALFWAVLRDWLRGLFRRKPA